MKNIEIRLNVFLEWFNMPKTKTSLCDKYFGCSLTECKIYAHKLRTHCDFWSILCNWFCINLRHPIVSEFTLVISGKRLKFLRNLLIRIFSSKSVDHLNDWNPQKHANSRIFFKKIILKPPSSLDRFLNRTNAKFLRATSWIWVNELEIIQTQYLRCIFCIQFFCAFIKIEFYSFHIIIAIIIFNYRYLRELEVQSHIY